MLFVTLLFSFFPARAGAKPTGGVWADSPVGNCYASLEKYLAQTFGPDYMDDDNIQVTDAFGGSKQYKWVRDITPGINITRILFKLERDRRACAILFIPFASTVREIRSDQRTELPSNFVAFDSPPPGFPGTEIMYQLDAKMNTYYPRQCLQLFSAEKKREIDSNFGFK